MMNLEQRVLADAALQRYGAGLTADDHIAKGGKVMSVRVDVKKGRLVMLGPGAATLASYPASKIEKGVSDFVEKFWFWKPTSSALASSHATVKSAAEARAEELDVQIAPTLGRSRSEIVRRINAIVRAADGRNVYVTRERLGAPQVERIVRARTKGRGMEVRSLASGRWIPVMPELGDRIDVR